jgi:hypothetical protein
MPSKPFPAQLAFILIAATAVAASSFPVHRYIPIRALAFLVDVLTFVVITSLPRIAQVRWMRSQWLLIALLSVFFIEALFVYPIADARKLHGQGSDQDDALIQAATLLRHGQYPYRFHTYDKKPISDGPGWVILHMPMYSLRMDSFEAPTLFAFLAWILRRRSDSSAFLFAATLFCSPIVHMAVSEGSDLPALSGAIFLLCLTTYKRAAWSTALWIVLCGLIITARINLIVLPIAMLCFRTDWRTARAWIETVGSVLLALTLHIVFYLVAPTLYAPLHLVGKGDRYLSLAIPVLALCALLLILLIVRCKAESAAKMAVLIGIFLLLTHIPLAFGALIWATQHGTFWEGFEYLNLCLVCLIGGSALLAGDRSQRFPANCLNVHTSQ